MIVVDVERAGGDEQDAASPGGSDRRWRLVTQPDHAHFSLQLGRLWRLHGLPGHRRRDELLFAVREHDNGWREVDSAPRWNPATGQPHNFTTLPRPERCRLWLRGTDRCHREHPWASLLIIEHARALHHRHGDPADADPELEEFLRELDERRASLLEQQATQAKHPGEGEGQASAAPAEEVVTKLADLAQQDYAWLDLLDLASLAVCQGRTEPFERTLPGGERVTGRAVPGTLHLEPFPLAGATTFQVPCRYLPVADYAGDVELAVALARARWESFTVQVAPFAQPPGPLWATDKATGTAG